MRSVPLLKAALALLAFGLCGTAAGAATRAPAERTLIRNVSLITLDERGVIESASVLTANGRIEAILTRGQREPSGLRLVDGSGQFLMAGLIDSHMHYQSDNELASYLRYGITTVFSLGTPGSLEGLLQARRRLAEGSLVGAHLYASGPSIPGHRALADARAADSFVTETRRDGLELVKVYNEIPRDVFDAIIAGARRRGMGVFGHIPRRFPPEHAIANGLNVIAHMEEFFFAMLGGPRDSELDTLRPDWAPDHARIDPILDLVAAHDVAIIPNLVASSSFQNLWEDEDRELSLPDGQYIDPEIFAQWRTANFSRRNRIAQRMVREQIKYPLIRLMTYRASQKGILLLAGTDAPIPALYPGRSLHQELRLLAAAGLTFEQALRTATINGGIATRRFVDGNACIGVIRVGCEADLVLLRANPLEDIRNTQSIVGVMTDGRWHTREELDALAGPQAR